jgi:hypothetical protein
MALILLFISPGRSWLIEIIAACFIFACLVIFSQLRPRTLRPVEELLVTNDLLRSRLLGMQKNLEESREAKTVSIPEAEYKQIARIEQALISLDRKRTIEQRRKEPNKSMYAVQQSRTILKKKSALEPSIRLRIQTRIDELTTDPQPLDASLGSDSTWRLSVPGTSWQISYTLVGDPQFIMINDLLKKAKSKQKNQEREDSA